MSASSMGVTTRRAGSPLVDVAASIGVPLYAAGDQELDDLEAVESRVAHHRRHHAPASQVDESPDGAEQADGDRGVPALHPVARAEGQARDDEAYVSPTEMALESREQERALHFLSHRAADERDHGEGDGLEARLQHRPE